MLRTERTFQWDGSTVPTPAIKGPLAISLDRRRLLTLAGAAAAGIVLAAPALPATSVGGSTTAATSVAPAALEVGQFLSLIGETFTARILTGEYEDTRGRLVLSDVSVPEAIRGERRPADLRSQPFSLLFTLGAGAIGKSGIVRFEHDAIGNVELFVHQVRQASSDAPVYEAVLN
ncbi:MAG: hypothetical protein R3A46_16875 [Thermomicrobiales bacterium]